MTTLIEYPGYEPVVAPGNLSCTGCAFEGQRLMDNSGARTDCSKVICFGYEFPTDHVLWSETTNVVWVRKESV